MKTFTDRLVWTISVKESILCIGFDPQLCYMPEQFEVSDIVEKIDQRKPLTTRERERAARAIVAFNKEIIQHTASLIVAGKPQIAFYEFFGSWGIWAFEETCRLLKEAGILVIEDAKRGDGGDTAIAYAEGHLGESSFADINAMTIQPGIGNACIDPFVNVVERTGNGVFVVTKTSFTPNSFVENLIVKGGGKVWEAIAADVNLATARTMGEHGYSNLGVVMGATYPEDADRMRELMPNSFFLVPGYGAQGGGAAGAVRGADKKGSGIVVNSSRGILFAYRSEKFRRNDTDFALAAADSAEFSRNDLNKALAA